MRHFTSSGTDQCQNGLSSLRIWCVLTQYCKSGCCASPGFPRQQQCLLPLACHHLPKGTKSEKANVVNNILNHGDSQLAAFEGEPPALRPPERPSHTHTTTPGFGGRGHEVIYAFTTTSIAQVSEILSPIQLR